jgi:hypothetical protein
VGEHAHERLPRWARVGGIRRTIYENSLLLVMGAIWLATWFAQSVTGASEYNSERLDHHQAAVSWAEYLTRPDFWEKTLQNWQVRVPRRGVDGDPRGLPPTARLARVETGGRRLRLDRHRGLTDQRRTR